jgi:hypothetical protein
VAVTDLSEEPTYDAALSFAGEDRDFVKEVAEELKRRGIRIFIDEDNAATMWGEDLYTFLDNVYRRQSRFVIIFVSKHYVAKPWTNHERQSAQAKALLEKGAYILPVRLDDSELPGLRPTISYLNGRIGPKALADALQVKLGGSDLLHPKMQLQYHGKVPRTSEDTRLLLRTKPNGWEYLLYGGVLLQGVEALEERFRDNEIRFAKPSGIRLHEDTAMQYLRDKMSSSLITVDSLNKTLEPHVWQRAFGAPGTHGDEVFITHLATRLIDAYAQLLDDVAEIRGVVKTRSI